MIPLASDYSAWNPCHYVHNNPISLIDPTGMSADTIRFNAVASNGMKTTFAQINSDGENVEFNIGSNFLEEYGLYDMDPLTWDQDIDSDVDAISLDVSAEYAHIFGVQGQVSIFGMIDGPDKGHWGLAGQGNGLLGKEGGVGFTFSQYKPRDRSDQLFLFDLEGFETGGQLSLDFKGWVRRGGSGSPLAEDYAAWNPYNYVLGNPVLLTDPDGREPILPLVGTIQQAINFFRNNGLNTVGAIDNFYRNPVDQNGNALNNANFVRYVYTENNGWVDLRHYVGTFIRGETAMDALEIVQCAGGLGSCYSYEDLPSNRMGGDAFRFIADADFSPLEDKDYVPRTGEELFNGILEQFGVEGATAPENAPNFSVLPTVERPKVPSINGVRIISGFVVPTFFSSEEQQQMINTGQFVPQNYTEEPFDLNNFPTPADGFR